MSNRRGSSDEESELVRTKLKLDQAQDKFENMEAFYNKLFVKFTKTSISYNADKKLLESCMAEKTALTAELRKTKNELLERNMELQRVSQELTIERRKTNQLRLQLDQAAADGRKLSRSFGEDAASEASGSTDTDTSLELARRRYDNRRPAGLKLAIRTPHVLQQQAKGNTVGISPISLPSIGGSSIDMPSPLNHSTPTTDTSTCVIEDSTVQPGTLADISRPRMKKIPKTKKLSSITEALKKLERPQPTVSFAEIATKPKHPRLIKTDSSMEEREMDDMDDESQVLLHTTVVQEGTIWTPPTVNDPDFILVRIAPQPSKTGKVTAKAKPKHFVAKVVGYRVSRGGEGATLYQVQYYCKRAGRAGVYFVLSTVNENTFEVEQAQIILNLPSPVEGRRGLLTFPAFLFDPYLMG